MSAVAEQKSVFTPDVPGWAALFAAIDSRDAAAFAGFLTPDAEFRFGNNAPVHGRADITAAVAGFFALLASCRHRMTGSWRGASSAVCEGQVSYGVAGNATVTLPFVNVLELTPQGISSYRIYIDNGPLFAALGAPGAVGSSGGTP